MSATKSSLAQGAAFFTGVAGSPITYTQVLELKEINPPDETVGDIDATNLGSPNNAMEFIPGLYNGGQIEISGNYIGDTAQEGLGTLLQGRTVFPWKITLPCNSGTQVATLTGTGFLTKHKRGPASTGKLVEFSSTLKVTGEVTATVA